MKLLTLLCTLLLAPAFVFAGFYMPGESQSRMVEGDKTLALGAGVGFPLSDLKLTATGGGSSEGKIGEAGLNIGGEFFYYAAPAIAVGLNGNYSKFGENNTSEFDPGVPLTSKVNARSTVILAMVKYLLVTNKRSLPYLTAGFGFHSTDLKFDLTPNAGVFWTDTRTAESRALIDDTKSSFAFAIGGGSDFLLNEHITIGFETRYQYLGKVTYSPTPRMQALLNGNAEAQVNMIAVLARVGYKF